MNHIYRLVWNCTTHCWQAVCETARGRGKPANRSRGGRQRSEKGAAVTIGPALAAALATLAFPALAAPTGGQVTAGSARISSSGATTTINQASQKAAIDWTKFSIGKGEAVVFQQPNASAIALNRVTGTESSAILGRLSANGQVFILNPNGVLFGKDAQVNVGGLIASTGRLSNADFLAGNLRFTGGTGSVVNEGNITVAPGGTLALIAPVVSNTGTLSAPEGSVLLAAADDVSVTLQDGSLVSYTLTKGNAQALVDNGGMIVAEGGHVVLTAKGLDALSRAAVNHSGIIEAQTVSNKSGVVELLADMESGQVTMSGRIDASAPSGGDGGFVETSAASVQIGEGAAVTTAARQGTFGNWLIDPLDFTISPGSAPRTNSGIGAVTLSDNLNATNVEYAVSTDPAGGEAGRIFVNGEVSWWANTRLVLTAHDSIEINKNITATGATAGLVLNPHSGTGNQYHLNDGATISLRGANSTFTVSGQAYTVIHTPNQLQAMKDNLSGFYVLGDDIDASATAGWNSGAGFEPIGALASASRFRGRFDGLNHTVSELFINRPTTDYVGLIGFSDGGVVQNIRVSNVSVTGRDNVGALIGMQRNGALIHNAFSSGTVAGRTGVGGLAGISYYYDPLTGGAGAGSTIEYSASAADVSGQDGVGGLVHYIDRSIVRNSYATGDVTGSSQVGGLVGASLGGSSVVNSYATGRVTATSGSHGGLIAVAGGASSSYFDSETTGQAGGNTTPQMQQQATFAGWDFTNVWRITEGSSYPQLRNLATSTRSPDPTPTTPQTPTPTPSTTPGTTALTSVGSVITKNAFIPLETQAYLQQAANSPKQLPEAYSTTPEEPKPIDLIKELGITAAEAAYFSATSEALFQILDLPALRQFLGSETITLLQRRGNNFVVKAFKEKLRSDLTSVKSLGFDTIKNILVELFTDFLKDYINQTLFKNLPEFASISDYLIDLAAVVADAALTTKNINLPVGQVEYRLKVAAGISLLSMKQCYKTGNQYWTGYQLRLNTASDSVVNLALLYQRADWARSAGDFAKAAEIDRLIAHYILTDPMAEAFGLDHAGTISGDLARALYLKNSGRTEDAKKLMVRIEEDARTRDLAEHPFTSFTPIFDTPFSKTYTEYFQDLAYRLGWRTSDFPSHPNG